MLIVIAISCSNIHVAILGTTELMFKVLYSNTDAPLKYFSNTVSKKIALKSIMCTADIRSHITTPSYTIRI